MSLLSHRLIPMLVTDHDTAEVNKLLSQLTTMKKPLAIQDLRMIAEKSFVLVSRDEEGSIMGMGTLHACHKLSGTIGTIEDVVVDASLSGRGIGTELILQLIAAARICGIKKIELTSNPKRLAANYLYQKLGFELRETNHYRMTP